MSFLWNTILVNPILNLLVAFYSFTGGNLGWAIIFLTLAIRAILIPVVMPSMKTMQKQKEIQPELEALRKKYKGDRQKLAEEQMKLFQKNGINPASGCLTQIVMLIVLIALYNVISLFSNGIDLVKINEMIYFIGLKFAEGVPVNTSFLYMDLTKPDPFYIIPVLAAATQFLASKMMMPSVSAGTKLAKKTADKSDDFAYNMQEQMLYLMPVMTGIVAISLPSGIGLYILATTVFSVGQQYFVNKTSAQNKK